MYLLVVVVVVVFDTIDHYTKKFVFVQPLYGIRATSYITLMYFGRVDIK